MPRLQDGVAVTLQDLRNNHIAHYDNPYSKDIGDDCNKVYSHLVRFVPNEAFGVRIDFCRDFKLGSASGVKITIAFGHDELDSSEVQCAQSWWIDQENMYRSHTFRYISEWSDEMSEAKACRFRSPIPDGNPEKGSTRIEWHKRMRANQGCIAVFIQPAHFTYTGSPGHRLSVRDPPSSQRHKATDIPKVINSDWLVLEESSNAPSVTYEFRLSFDPIPSTSRSSIAPNVNLTETDFMMDENGDNDEDGEGDSVTSQDPGLTNDIGGLEVRDLNLKTTTNDEGSTAKESSS